MLLTNNNSIVINGQNVYGLSRSQGLRIVGSNSRRSGQYESSVAAIIDAIGRRETGRILLGEIQTASHANSRRVEIFAFNEANAASGGDPEDQTPYGLQVRDSHGRPRSEAGDDPHTRRIERRGEPILGTGRGINPTLLFDPVRLSAHTSATAGFSAEEALFHELVHSKRQIQARSVNLPMGGQYDNNEEFIAILVTNIYSSEGGATWLRGNHRMPGTQTDMGTILDIDAHEIFSDLGVPQQPTASNRFAERYHRELNDFARSDAQFSRRLALVRAHFNPVRDHMVRIGAISVR